MSCRETLRVGGISGAAAYLFFLEYLPPFRRVHFPYDIQGYHYPLLDYAFQALRAGRIPEWDPTQYCGLSFIGNPQGALFYPPNWLLFASNLGRGRLSYLSLEILVIAHFWLAFLLCYAWLRGKRLVPLACALGASVFAYGGYMVSQVEHVGVVTGYAWFPLGLWGIDQAAESRSWRPLWKLAAASALCFLAGYPPQWFVFAVCMTVYAATRRVPWRTATVLAGSLLMVAVQLLPALEAAAGKTPELKYDGGIYGLKFYLSYFIPNFFDPGRPSPVDADPTRQYLYLGVPGLFALMWLIRRTGIPGSLPALAIGGVSLLAFSNPLGLVGGLVNGVPALGEICRGWNFLAGLTLAAALLSALALDDFLRRPLRPPHWLTPLSAALLAAWALGEWLVWLHGGAAFAPGWAGLVDPGVTLALFTGGLCALRGETGWRRGMLAAILLLAAGVDYKVFGTSKLFNADAGNVDQQYAGTGFPALDDAVYREVRSKPEFRVGLQSSGPLPTDLRLFGLNTPQGFDPMLPAAYKRTIESFRPFRTDRLFDIDPRDEGMLRLLAVRYFLTDESGPLYPILSGNPKFRGLPPARSFYRIFEYRDAVPAYRWEQDAGTIESVRWEPERREFVGRSSAGGRFILIEQYFPGWTATVDEEPVTIERWSEAFQSIQVPAGEHRIRFEFRSVGLRIGAIISGLSLFAAAIFAFIRGPMASRV